MIVRVKRKPIKKKECIEKKKHKKRVKKRRKMERVNLGGLRINSEEKRRWLLSLFLL